MQRKLHFLFDFTKKKTMFQITEAPRGLRHFPDMKGQLFISALLVMATSAGIYLLRGPIFAAWMQAYAFLSSWVGLPSEVQLGSCALTELFCRESGTLSGVTLNNQTLAKTVVGILVAAAFATGSFLVDGKKVALRYGLRILATLILAPSVLLVVIPQYFNADELRHVAQILHTGYLFLLLTPLIMGLTGFIFPGRLDKKYLVLLSTLAYFFILVPVLAVLHLVALDALGHGFLPLLNMLGTTLLFSFELAAFYGLLASQD